MTKYNEGDILEITEDFVHLGATFKKGDKYKVTAVTSAVYNLRPLQAGHSWTAYPKEFDLLETIRKVEFKVGDKVRLLETAHGSPGYSTDTPEAVKERLTSAGLDYQTVFEVDQKVDSDGDVHVFHGEKYVGLYLLPEFLVPWVEEEKPAEHMELGKTYQSTSNDLFYTPTEFDFEAERVAFDYTSEPDSLVYKSARPFYAIEGEFGVLPPVRPVELSQVTLDDLKEQLKPENTLASAEARIGDSWESSVSVPEPETVSVDALREAWDYVDHEYPDIEKLIKLAKRLS